MNLQAFIQACMNNNLSVGIEPRLLGTRGYYLTVSFNIRGCVMHTTKVVSNYRDEDFQEFWDTVINSVEGGV